MARFLLITAFIPLLAFSQTLTFTDGSSHDFGEITDKEKVSHDVKFKNSGDQKLIISSVKASCGCTTGKLDKKEYEPGEEGSVTLTFNPRGKYNKQTKNLTFNTNDPEKKSQVFPFTAFIKTDFMVNGRFMFRYENDAFTSDTASVKLQNNTASPISVDNIQVRNALAEYLTVVDAPPLSVPAKGTIAIKLKIDSEYAPVRTAYTTTNLTITVNGKSTTKPVTTQIIVPKPPATPKSAVPPKPTPAKQ
ncbi:MAG TPA: hypothetical protein DCR55_15970 [Lentisphaeria bacterium]|jgi:hypothetical protein|nr:hypothetical protein [Lentisphaeria bacterium]